MGAAAALQSREPLDEGLSSQAGAGRPVDLVHLSRFTLGDEKLEREILQLFRVQARLYLERLEQARDALHWRQAAHTIKGSAKGIGAWAVASAAQRAEELPKAPGGKGATAAVRDLKAAVETAIGFIDVLLAEH